MKFTLIPFIIFLSACSPIKPTPQIQIVTKNVPVLYCPLPPTIPDPVLDITYLIESDIDNNPGKVAEAYITSILQLKSVAQQREYVLEAYRKMKSYPPNIDPIEAENRFKQDIKQEN